MLKPEDVIIDMRFEPNGITVTTADGTHYWASKECATQIITEVENFMAKNSIRVFTLKELEEYVKNL